MQNKLVDLALRYQDVKVAMATITRDYNLKARDSVLKALKCELQQIRKDMNLYAGVGGKMPETDQIKF